MGEPIPKPPAAGATAALVERLRKVHTEMLDAVLGGDGLVRVAELAAAAAGAPVAIVIPRIDVAVVAPAETSADLAELESYVRERMRDRPVPVPPWLALELPVTAGDEVLGAVALLHGGKPEAHAHEFLHLAAVTSLTEVAVAEAREEVEENLRGSFLEDLRSRGDLDAREIVRRAGRLGCDLSRGGAVLCAELASERPRHVIAIVVDEYPGALAQHIDRRIYAILPTREAGAAETTMAGARRLAARLQRHGTVGVSSVYADPGAMGRAIQEAELVLEVTNRSGIPISDDIGTGTYRLLFRVLASHPEEVRAFYEDTVAPIVGYDRQYGTDLVGTLEAYLEHNCNMNATAAAIYAHRHTVAYRLDRVRELSGLDPVLSEDRERLGLGLKAYRIIAPRLPR